MPNTRRRRRFSVHNEINDITLNKTQNEPNTSKIVAETDNKQTTVKLRKPQLRNAVSVIASNNLSIITDCCSSTSMQTVPKESNYKLQYTKQDKDVTACASNIDLFNILRVTDSNLVTEKSEKNILSTEIDSVPNKIINTKPVERDSKFSRRDKPRQHRVKVRSPRRRVTTAESQTKTCNKISIGSAAIDWEQELEALNIVHSESIAVTAEGSEAEEERTNNEFDDMCRICHGGESLNSELGPLVSACSCRGTVGRVHVKCLEHWLTESGKSRCELCGIRYATRRVHRYGVPRALLMWILSQNAKQLMIDSLGIMLMSPLAVLAAWLSGRTLAGLMMQESHAAPWPLASTFVLACMTLVCYYCWIVSAATRHALGWWIWYRSQYEVRLELNIAED